MEKIKAWVEKNKLWVSFFVGMVVFFVALLLWEMAGRKGPMPDKPIPPNKDADQAASAEISAAQKQVEIEKKQQEEQKRAQDALDAGNKQAGQEHRKSLDEIERLKREGTNQDRVKHLLKDDDLR